MNSTNKIRTLSFLIPTMFYLSCLIYFSISTNVYKNMDVLNILQLNIKGVYYHFIIAIFGYAIPGTMSVFLWIYIARKFIIIRKQVIPLLIAGCILISLSFVQYNSSYPSAGLYVLLSSLSYLFFSAIGIFAINSKLYGKKITMSFFIVNVVPIFLFYDVFSGLLLPNSNLIPSNTSTILCLSWYFTLPKYLTFLNEKALI